MSLSFREFSEFCSVLERISSTLEMTARIAAFIKKIEDDNDLYNVILFLMGQVYPSWDERELGVGVGLVYEALKVVSGVDRRKIENLVKELGDLGLVAERLIRGKAQMTLFAEELTIAKLREIFDKIASLEGEGSQKKKVMLLVDLYISATPIEARYLTRLVLGEMRLGVGEGIIRDAIARAFLVDPELVERAYMITNDLGRVAVVAKREGKEGLKNLKIELHVPVKMMLAQVAESIEEAIREMKNVAVEWKFDGSRVQVHWGNGKVTIYSRRLENVTKALPEIVEAVKKSVRENVILDGEVIAVKDGRPMPFQHVLRRFRRKHEITKVMGEISLIVYFFDILYDDGEIIDLPLEERRKRLESVVKENEIVRLAKQIVTNKKEDIEKVFREALDAGHEGAMLKNPKSPYIPGKRGKHWLKLKEVMETLDLVVIGGEWGEGRRSHLISSFELACRDPVTGKLLPVGKVGTGFTDEDLEELTRMFKPLIVYEDGKIVKFQPKIVFEVAYQEIQKSPKYESGYALRFPRFVRVRDDKSPDEADTIERIAQLYESQFKKKVKS